MKDYRDLADEIRLDIVKMYYRAGWGHLAPALSCVDILTILAFSGIADLSFSDKSDHFIISKGHGCAGLYSVLSRLGYFPREELNTFYQSGGRLVGLASPSVPGIDIPTGSLGHGICYATGLALADQMDENEKNTFVILGDGESQEGSVWEAAEFASVHQLSNLIVFLDKNSLQASDWIDAILPTEPIKEKWQSFGWNVLSVNGHKHSEIFEGICQAKKEKNKPTIIIANTVKGYGVSVAENKPDWHSRCPQGQEWDSVCCEFGIKEEELSHI